MDKVAEVWRVETVFLEFPGRRNPVVFASFQYAWFSRNQLDFPKQCRECFGHAFTDRARHLERGAD